MASPALRVDLSEGAPDFRLQVVQPGLPLLDRWNTSGALLGNWLGRFAAESTWDGDSVEFYVRDEQGRRLGDVTCRPAAAADLRGPLKKEVRELRTRLQQGAAPQSSSAQAIYDFVSPALLNPRSAPEGKGFDCQFFKYRDEQDRWRLLWCYGYRRAEGRELARPVICGNAECRQLALVNKGSDRKCPRCGTRLLKLPLLLRYAKRIAAVVALLVLLSACLLAVGLYVYTRPSAILTGRVLCAADRRPIDAAKVRIEGTELEGQTDAQGGFRIERAPGGAVTVRVSAPGFREEAIQAELVSRRETSIDVGLVGAARIAGKVVHALGGEDVPIAKAQVAVEQIEEPQAETDRNGDFSFSELPPGPVTIQVSAKGFHAAEVSANASVEGEPPLDVVLTGDGTIAGRVVYAVDESVPVPQAEVDIEGLEQARVRADNDGRFALWGVPPVRVSLQVSAKGFRKTRRTVEAGGSSISVPLTGDATLTGEVIRGDTNGPVPDAEILLSGTPFAARTAANGRFRLDGVRSGPIKIVASAPGLAGSESQSLPPDQETSVRIVLTGAATVRGRVVSAEDKSPIPEATVVIPETQLKTATDEQGQFTLPGVVPGPVVFDISAEGYFPEQSKIEATEGQQELDDVALRPAATLQGRVVSASGKRPLQGAEVRLGQGELKATTDEQGAFTMSGLPVGPATVHVSADAHCPAQVDKDLSRGLQTLDDVVLDPAASVSGLVIRGLDKGPIAGADVVIEPIGDANAALAGMKAEGRSGQDGRFTISGIPAGHVSISVAAAGFRPQQLKYFLPAGTQELNAPVAMEGDTALSGVTLDAEDKKRAVPNANIELRVAGFQTKLVSEANGGFKAGNLPSGLVRITARAEGYSDTDVQQRVGPDRAWIEVPMSRLINARGVVVEAENRKRPIAKANVRVQVGGTVQNAISAENGGFSVTVPAGEAEARATAAGFCDAQLNKRITAQDAWMEIPMVRGTSLHGSVVDATNNKPVPNARVEVEVAGVQKSASTDSQGEFEVTEIPVGNGTVDISAPGFESEQLNHQTGGADRLRVLLSPFVSPGTVRIVLAWGQRPPDLDGHLYGPLPNGARFHVGFEDKDADGVHLDVDAKRGFGPETITMKAIPGSYQYYVEHPENRGTQNGEGLKRSGAQVRVYYKQAQPQQLRVISAKIPVNALAPVWYAFDINVDQGGQIAIAPTDPKGNDTWRSELPAR